MAVACRGSIFLPDRSTHTKGFKTVPGKFELFKDKGGKFRFRLKATNGQVVGTSEQYDSAKACENGIKSVAKNAAGAKIEDLAG